jgi:hypothetical protein
MKPMINKTITIVPARMPPIMAPTFELLSSGPVIPVQRALICDSCESRYLDIYVFIIVIETSLKKSLLNIITLVNYEFEWVFFNLF